MNTIDRTGVHTVRLDCLLVDDGLDLLVDVVVNVLAGNGWCNRAGLLDLTLHGGVSELGSFSLEALLDLGVVAVLELAVLDGT